MLQEEPDAQPTATLTYYDRFKSTLKSATLTASGYAGGSMAVTCAVPAVTAAVLGYTGVPVVFGAFVVIERIVPGAFTPVYWLGSTVAQGVTSRVIDGSNAALTFAYARNNPVAIEPLQAEWPQPITCNENTRHPLDNSLIL